MELSKRNLIIVGGIILALIFGIILLGRKPAPKPVTTNPSSGPDFNVVKPSEEVVVFNTPTPTLEPTPTLLPTETPAPTEYPTPTLEPTLTTIPTQTPTQTPTVYSPTRKPTKTPTKTPTPDTSIKATGVSLSLTQLTLEINKTFQVLSKVEPDNTTDKSVYWSSRDAHIAIVDTNGNITGKSLGNTIITARTSNWKTTAVSVTVVNKPQPTSTIRVTPTTVLSQIYPESISLDNTSLSLKSNDTKQLKVTIKPQNTNQRSIKWSSSNGQVATVNVSGKVTAKNQGTANITVKTINGKKAVSKITVVGNQVVTPTLISNPPTNTPTTTIVPNTPTKTPTTTTVPNPPTNTPTTTIVPNTPTNTPTKTPTPTQIIINPSSLSLTPSDINLYLGDSLQITAKVKPDNAPNKTVNWSSSNANIASVSISGKVTTKTTGTANIIAKTINNITATTKVTVLPNPVTPTSTKTPTTTTVPNPPTNTPTTTIVPNTPTNTPTKTPTPTQIIINPSSLSLTPSDINLYLGDSLQITAKVKPDNAPNKTVNWSSSNANIASVSISGKVTTKTTGTANIIARTINNITATTKVTVLPNPVTPTSTKTPTPTRKPTPTPTKKPTPTPTLSPSTNIPGKITHESYGGMQYILYMPGNYNSSTKWPLLVYLHGWEKEPDINNMYKSGHIPRLLKDGNNFNAIIISPFSPVDWDYTYTQTKALAIVDYIISKYNVNSSKISITAHSNGVIGATDIIVNNRQNFFSSFVPIASSITSNSPTGLTDLKFWYFYGTNDVPETNRTKLVNAINTAGGDAKITAINGGHNIMKEVYLDNKMIEWMISQSR